MTLQLFSDSLTEICLSLNDAAGVGVIHRVRGLNGEYSKIRLYYRFYAMICDMEEEYVLSGVRKNHCTSCRGHEAAVKINREGKVHRNHQRFLGYPARNQFPHLFARALLLQREPDHV